MKKSKKRIGIDIRKFHDYGIGIYIRNIIKYLSRIDDDFEFFLFHSNGLELPQDLIKNGNGSWKLIKDNSPNYSIQEMVSLPCRMLWNKIDLFHSPHYATPLIKPCIGVVTIHDIIHYLFPEFLPNYAAIKYSRFMLKMAARNAKKIITVSQNSRKDIIEHLDVSPEKVEVIYNAVDDDFFKVADPSLKNKLEIEYGIRGQYILYVGNYLPHKNLERLFKAFQILLRNLETP
ncbi:glycosyltransferase family 4 protein, partial [bacterium]|nr:glycosyltransferase family 4 protein [bacterium]